MLKTKIKIKVNRKESIRKNRLRYVLDFLENHPSSEGNILFLTKGQAAITIDYQAIKENNTASFFIPEQALFFDKTKTYSGTLFSNTYIHRELKVYSVAQKANTEEQFLKGQDFSFDIFETIFFHISRYEEWFCPKEGKNVWDLMKTEEQFLVHHQLHRLPVVDRLVYAFFQALGLHPKRKITEYHISHDIDEIQKFSSIRRLLKTSGALFLKKGNWQSQQRLWQAYFSDKDPFDTFDWMLEGGGEREKTIYFLVGGKTVYDTPYELKTERMKNIFARCRENAYRIGIHPSYATFKEEELFRNEKQLLETLIGESISYSRQHYLHFDWLKTPEVLEKNKITCDSSIGFNECIGFRCGTGFRYRLYNFLEEKSFEFLEDPLVVMDSALLNESDYSPEQVQKNWNSFLTENSHFTRITFNFHNSRFFDAWLHDIPLQKMYKQLFKSP